MKRVFRTGAMLVALLATNMNFAAKVANTAVFSENITVTPLKLIKAGDHLVVKNRNGSVVMDIIASNSLYYEQVMSLQSLNDGIYTLEVINNTMVDITPFKIVQGKVVFDLGSEYRLFKPMVRIKDNLVFVSQLTFQQKPLKIAFYFNPDDDGSESYQLIHAEEVENTTKIGKVYSLNKNESGKYKLILKTEGRTFTEKFNQ